MVRTKPATERTTRQDKARPMSVGDEIRTIRKARGITLKQLSQRAGCSAAYLSRIERAEARISLDLLSRIGDELQVDPKWFFPGRSGEGSHEQSYVVRAGERRPLSQLYTRTTDELGFDDQLLSSSLSGDCYMMLTRFPPQSDASLIAPDTEAAPDEGYVYKGEQHGIVIQGCMQLILGNETITLNAGDSFSYPTTIPHRMRNGSSEEAIVVVTMTPVRINW